MAIPNFQTIDIAKIRETAPQQTSDIKFEFLDKNSGEKKELFAHKFVLAFGSEVFMTQFFGSLKEERGTILVEDASFEAFKMFLDLLYNKKVSTNKTSFKLLAELFYLSDKYIMVEMQELIIQEVASRKIVPGTLLEAAKIAEESVHMEKFSMSILKICASFIKEDITSVLEIFNSEEVGGGNSLLLHWLMAKSSQIVVKSVCEKCKEMQDGDTSSWNSCNVCLEDMVDSDLVSHIHCTAELCRDCLERSMNARPDQCPVCLARCEDSEWVQLDQIHN